MRRRAVVFGLAGMVAAPVVTGAQRKPMPTIGILGFGSPEHPAIRLNLAGLREGLAEAGFVEGQNVLFEYRWAHDDAARLPALAADLGVKPVDVIVTEGGLPTAHAAKAATDTVPVVFHTSDAIAEGLVTNLARPGGNLTGISFFAPELVLKEFELLLDLLPGAKSVGVLVVPKNMIADPALRQIEQAAQDRGVTLHFSSADTASDVEMAFANFHNLRVDGVISRANAIFTEQLVTSAARYRLPAVYGQRAFPDAGGLLSYGVSLPAVYVVKGIYTGRILRGEKPRDLPVQQPTSFELVINLKTAKALGLTVPPSLLARADEVIE